MRVWSKYTCLKFTERAHEFDYINIVPSDECYSSVGCRRGPQFISLNNNSCMDIPIILHELGHAIGLYHEHSRPDRDNLSNPNGITLETIDEDYADIIGKATVLSFYDVMPRQRMYNCSDYCQPPNIDFLVDTVYPKSKDRILEEEEISNTKYKTGDVLIVENNRSEVNIIYTCKDGQWISNLVTPQLRIIRSPADVSDLQASGRLDTSEPFALDE
ncbi:zinc metalloproteinase nas-6-like [Dreissena polymorpha]|uniref:zinc metalloproteinase nas-6-like n=1 Tax=Dreissena polymorpha TaxID=45954 RepID=UPI0022644E9E|nr:zinc metalloproteinase nas-6-like [Dreissena polymorpha]